MRLNTLTLLRLSVSATVCSMLQGREYLCLKPKTNTTIKYSPLKRFIKTHTQNAHTLRNKKHLVLFITSGVHVQVFARGC